MSNQTKQPSRWFSTGFLAKGAGKVNFNTHTLEMASVIQVGEAKGHGLWIDSEFCNSVVVQSTLLAEKGVKARFGHPDMCSDALGTFIGKWKQLTVAEDGVVKGNLYLSSTASDSPRGDLRKYVEEMANQEPDHFGCSIVFTRDEEAEINFSCQNGAVIEFGKYANFSFVKIGECKTLSEVPEGNDIKVNKENWKSPDPLNVNNYPHARLSKLHAADLVDDPAATDSMFSGIGGTQLASKVSEYLDTHPEILKALSDNNEIVEILSKYPDQIKPFIDRFTANRKEETNMEAEKITEVAESTTTTTTVTTVEKTEEAEPAETAETVKPEEAKPVEEVAPPSGELATVQKEVEELKKAKDKADAELAEKSEIEKLKAEKEKLSKELEESNNKLNALSNGSDPVSSTSAEKELKTSASPWADAQKRK